MLPIILAQALMSQGYLELQMDRPGAKKIIQQYERPAPPVKPNPSVTFPVRTIPQDSSQSPEPQLPSSPVHLDFITNPVIPERTTAPVIVKNNSPYNVSNVKIMYQNNSGQQETSCGSYLRRGETCETSISGPATVQMIQGKPVR